MIQIDIENFGILETREGDSLYRVLSEAGLMEGPCGGRGTCGKCGVLVDGEWTLSCTCHPQRDISVVLPRQAGLGSIVADGYVKEFQRDAAAAGELGVVIDIGTTTVVAALVDLTTGSELAALSCLNSQKVFGQDVISRIHFASESEEARRLLQGRILEDLRSLILGLAEGEGAGLEETDIEGIGLERTSGRGAEAIRKIVIAGNTTMIHLLAKADTSRMGRSPYTPAFIGPLTLSASELSLPAAPGAEVYCIPAVSAFVGGDITSGVLACGLEKESGNVLFIDIGTNGEIVLKKGDSFFCCSCAAGPALEGMNISCGMRAAEGAIEEVRIDGEQVFYQMIGSQAGQAESDQAEIDQVGIDQAEASVAEAGGNVEAGGGTRGNVNSEIGVASVRGICGSGILAAVSELRRTGLINKGGRLGNHSRIETEAGKKRFVLDRDREIYLTQKDIRQVQLAKGAILSGIRALLAAAGLSEDGLDKVLVAGQFGAHLKPESLTGSGILPESWTGKIGYVGNTSKSGAYICLLSAEERQKAERLSEQMRYIELSSLEGYEKLFVQCLSF